MLTMIGIDPHKDSHTATSVDGTGAVLASLRVKARPAGHAELIGWARQNFPGQRCWAVEDERNMAGQLLRDLLAAGEKVVPVPAHIAAGERRHSRRRGKNDPNDAAAAARAALREQLPELVLDQPSREIKMLSDHRGALVAERTRHQNRLRDLLHQLDPDLAAAIPPGGLTRISRLAQIIDAYRHRTGVEAEIVVDLAHACHDLTEKINKLEKRLPKLLDNVAAPLRGLRGCGDVLAAIIVGEVAGVRRFRNDAALAMFAGIAPIDASSGNNERQRLNRGGNRYLNYAIHMVAINQLRLHPPAREYYQNRIQSGKTPKEAIRSLKRQIIRRVYNLLQRSTTTAPTTA